MSIALKKRPAEGVPTPSPTHLTFFVDQNGNPSLKDSSGVVTPATNAGGPAQYNEQSEDPAPVANAVKVYAKDVNARAELYALDDADSPVRLTQEGHVSNNYNIRWNGAPGYLFDSTNTVPTLADVKQIVIDPSVALFGEGEIPGLDEPVVVSAGDRVLRACALTETENQVDNGIYIVQTGDWTRATDADTGEEIQDAIVEYSEEGEDPPWVVRMAFWNPSGVPITVGVDPQNWVIINDFPPSEVYAEVNVVAVDPITLSGTQTIDGVSLTGGETVLVAGQANPVDNGVYVVAGGSWQRDTEFDEGYEISGGTVLKIVGGNDYGGRLFVLNHPYYRSITIGVDAQSWILLDTEDLPNWGPVRIDVDYYDMVMGRSYAPTYYPTNGLCILTMPPITPESAGKQIVFYNYISTKTKKKLSQGEEWFLVVQPSELDSVSPGLAPGETATVFVEGWPIMRFISDGIGTWLVETLGVAAQWASLQPTPPTP